MGYYSLNSDFIIQNFYVSIIYYTRRKNILDKKLEIELGPRVFGRGIKIYHNNIIVNDGLIVSDDCELDGDNYLENKGLG